MADEIRSLNGYRLKDETARNDIAKIRAELDGLSGGNIDLDATLTQAGKAADAKITGDKIAAVETAQTEVAGRVDSLETTQTDISKRVGALEAGGGSYSLDDTLTKSGYAADAKAVGVQINDVRILHAQLRQYIGELQPGLTSTEKTLLLTLLNSAAYGSADAADSFNALKALWEDTGENVPVQSISITPATLNLVLGGSATLTANVLPITATNKTVTWSVSPTGIVTVNGGAVQAVGVGSCVVTATAGGVSGTCAVEVEAAAVPATAIALNKTTLELDNGSSETLTATLTPTNSTDKVIWTANPAGIVTVSGGVVQAVNVGNCVITAAAGSVSATCAVTVKAAMKEVIVDTAVAGTGRVWNTRTPLCQSLYVPLTIKQDFMLKKLDFMINLAKNTSIEVSFYNKTEGKNEGTNVTLAGTEGDYHAVVDFGGVDVLAGNEYQIWLNSTEKDAMCYPYVRDAVIAENNYFDITGTAYRWNNPVIKYLGYVVLTQDTSANIEVKSITLSQNELALRVGGSATLKATVIPNNATDRKVVWSVSPSGYVTVTDGEVSATAAGSCVITATAGGKSATCAVTVKEASAPALLYELPNETTLVSSSKQSIDTGIKLFENAGTEPPVYTILLDMAVASDISYNVNLSPCIMHAYDEVGDSMGTNLAIWGNGKVMLSYNGDTQAFAGVTKPADMFTRAKYAIQINGLNIRSCKAGALGDWTTGTNALENIDETLLLGAGRGSDGGIIRYFDGTFYAAKVYSGLLSDTELNEFLQG